MEKCDTFKLKPAFYEGEFMVFFVFSVEFVCLDLENDPDFDDHHDTEDETLTLIQSEDTVNTLTKQFMEHLSDKKRYI